MLVEKFKEILAAVEKVVTSLEKDSFDVFDKINEIIASLGF